MRIEIETGGNCGVEKQWEPECFGEVIESSFRRRERSEHQ
jgi:hypothetical protein